jgi:hypothetical protein
VIQEDDNGGEGPLNTSSQDGPSQTLTPPMFELSSDSDSEEVSPPFTPYQPPEETALERRLREVAVELNSELEEDPFTPFNHPPGRHLQGA